ncbi:hypothetical protein FEM08_26570 [Flavobacterium gilvum]|nr:hypothetical protein FEM08_26570 [Flavobacterium gilvum]
MNRAKKGTGKCSFLTINYIIYSKIDIFIQNKVFLILI